METNKREPIMSHERPSKPWQYIASDLFDVEHRKFILVVDRYSHFPLLQEYKATPSSQQVTATIKGYCAMFGCPEELMSDNGPQYAGDPFKNFCREWHISHKTSSPHYAQSNGFIERHVKHIKTLIRKAIQSGDDLNQVMLNIRATPIDSKLKSPGQLMFGRQLNTILPHRSEPGNEPERDQLRERQEQAEKYFPNRRELPPFHLGQNVRILNDKANGKTWMPAKIINRHDQRSYIVETASGKQLRRNRLHIHESTSPESSQQMPQSCKPPPLQQRPETNIPTEALPSELQTLQIK